MDILKDALIIYKAKPLQIVCIYAMYMFETEFIERYKNKILQIFKKEI